MRRNRARPHHFDIGQRLIAIRNVYGVRQIEICAAIGVQPNRWNQYEKGTRRIPPDIVGRLRSVFAVTADFVYFGDSSGLPARILPDLYRSHRKPVLA
jgi:transcriptional regulator with XRE-family HTH domain